MRGKDKQASGPGGALAQPPVVARFPAAANQIQIWRMEQSGSYGTSLNVAICRHLNGKVSDSAIGQAIQQLVDRHEILRTRFVEDRDDGLIQEVLASSAVKLDVLDLRTLDQDTRETERIRVGESQARQPFDLVSSGPLFRALLVRISSESAYLYLTFHSLVIDGWSLDLVGREIGLFAQAADSGSPADLGPVDLQFGDFANWQRDAMSAGEFDGDRQFWRSELAGLQSFTLPPTRADEALGRSSKIRSVMVDRAVSERFEKFAHKNNITMFSASCAAAARGLQEMTGRSEIVFGTQVASRDDPASEGIVGPVGNVVVLRLPLTPGTAFHVAASRVHDIVVQSMTHSMLPFEAVAADQAPNVPLFRVNFTVQRTYISSASVRDRQYGTFRMESVPGPSVGAQNDLSLFMVGREAGWRLSCEYSPSRYDEATIDKLLDAWLSEISGAVAEPDCVALAPMPPEPAALRINPRIEDLRRRIVCLQPSGEGTPVMALNISSMYYPVARAIGTDNPFFDLHLCPSETQMELPARHFTDHARDAVEMIRLARPTGPYILMGLCVSGALAVEAARLLQSEGETVELVGLVDSYRPGYREHMGAFDFNLRRWQVLLMSTRRLVTRWRSGELTLAQVLGNYRIMRTRIAKKILSRVMGTSGIPAVDAMAEHNRWFAETVLLPSQARMDMQPYPGKVVVFRSAAAPTGRLFPRDFGWAGFGPAPIEVVDVPGTHDTIFRPEGAAVIGSVIRQVSDRGPTDARG